MSPEIDLLIDQYWNSIEIEYTEFYPVDHSSSDAAYINVRIPLALVTEYQQLRGMAMNSLPEPERFWRETRLCQRLRESPRPVDRGGDHGPLFDVLEYLDGKVVGKFERNQRSQYVNLCINDIPAADYPDDD